MHKLVSLIGMIAISGALAGVGSAPSAVAGADSPSNVASNSLEWVRFHQEDSTAPAGRGCTFAVDEHVVADREFFMDVATYPDGTTKTQLWKGPLVMRFTNADSGESVVRNLSGRSVVTYDADGSFSSITLLTGHFAGTIRPGSDIPAGIYRIGGTGSTLSVEEGVSHLALGPKGSAENLCDALAG